MAFGNGYFGTLVEGAVNAATGGLLGVGLDAISGAINNKYQKQMIDYQVDAQKDLQDYAYQQQLDFWDKQNAYNDPSAMVNRLRQAGLNPAMLNGNSAVNQAGNLSSIATPSVPQGGRQSANPTVAMTSLASIAQSMAQTGFLDEQAKLMTQKILSELLEQNIKEIAALTGMSEAEIKRMDSEATYEAYYGTGIDGGPLRIKNNPISLAMSEQRQRIASGEAQEAYTRALETTENTLRDLRVSNLNASTHEINQRVDNLMQEYRRLEEEIDTMSRENAVQSAYRVIGNFYGLESIGNLPPELIAKASEYYQDFMRGDYSYESTIDAFRRIVNAYNEKKIHISTSISEAESLSLQPFKSSSSYSISYTH